MKFDFKDLSAFELPSEHVKNTKEKASCIILIDDKPVAFSAELSEFNGYRLDKPEVKLAFLIAAKIINHLDTGDNFNHSDFSLPKGGHMVKLGDYNSYGDNAESSKRRVNDGLKKIAGFEFYLCHALLAYEHQTHKRQLTLSSLRNLTA